MKKIITVFVFIFSSGIFAHSSLAQAEASVDDKGWGWGFSVVNLWVSSEASERERIGETALGVGFFADYNYNMWFVTLGMNAYFFDDRASFSQTTENQYGDTNDSESSANGYDFFAAVGPQWRVGKRKNVLLYTQAGFSHMFSSNRSIANCTNCYKEEIDLEGGPFLIGGVKISTSAGLFGFQLQEFIASDDFNRMLSISWTFNY